MLVVVELPEFAVLADFGAALLVFASVLLWLESVVPVPFFVSVLWTVLVLLLPSKLLRTALELAPSRSGAPLGPLVQIVSQPVEIPQSDV